MAPAPRRSQPIAFDRRRSAMMAPTAVKPVAWMIEAPRNPQASGSGAAHESARKTSAPDASAKLAAVRTSTSVAEDVARAGVRVTGEVSRRTVRQALRRST